MKKSIIFIGILSITLSLASCGGSTKGKWSEDDKKAFSEECNKDIKDLGDSGAKLCDCMLKKSEVEFNSFKDADSDEEKIKTIAEACLVEISE
jgi:hypothetical protein